MAEPSFQGFCLGIRYNIYKLKNERMLEDKGIKRPPIGMSDFRMVRNNNKYYVDKPCTYLSWKKYQIFCFSSAHVDSARASFYR